MALAKAGADTTVRSNTGAEPTLLAVLASNNKNGANNDAIAEVASLNASALEAKDMYGRTALAYLIASFQNNHVKLDDFKQSAMALAGAGADTTVRSNRGAEPTLLHVLVLNNTDGVNDTDIKTLLAKNPELINATTSRGRIPLQELLQNKRDTSVEEVEQLLLLGSDLNCVDNDGKTLLHTACATRNLDVAKHLAGRELDLTATTKNGSSMWHLCIPYGVNSDQEQDTAIHEWLYEQELDINQKNNEGKTALHVAAEYNNTLMIEWLLQHKADPAIQASNGKTALQIFEKKGFNLPAEQGVEYKISNLLKKLKNKATSLEERGETNAFEAANTLHEQLLNSFQTYMDAPVKNKAVFETLKSEFDAAIVEARPELEKHRSWWNDFTANLTMHIALLACTLGIGNVVALSYNYYQSGGQSMFFKMTTDSDKHVKNIEETVEQLGKNLPQ